MGIIHRILTDVLRGYNGALRGNLSDDQKRISKIRLRIKNKNLPKPNLENKSN
jgi:hypothetical protein